MEKPDLQNLPHWHAFYVQARHEKKVDERLKNKGIEVFTPMVTRIKQWSDRKKSVQEPLIRGYTFCKIALKDRMPVLETVGVINILRFAGNWAPIPEEQIETLQIMIDHPETLQPENYVKVGEYVRVISGPFTGARGIVQRIAGADRLILALDKIQLAFSVEVNRNDIKVLRPEELEEETDELTSNSGFWRRR
ncbi:MAG: UpxY family transcription antiterminator [Lentisphaeria bacterium]|nr:UpxY family transcription antiterminator [Candidatus Neomarinimicrobiota bacterium]MCF7841849.1 UpxY family transcription antiterminator [Lentisphaeria bacterium]